MQSTLNASLGPYNIDRQLVAQVQINAGAHCHKSANLLNCYYLSAQAYEEAINRKDEHDTQWAMKVLQDSEVNLRKFLSQCRQPVRLHGLADEMVEADGAVKDWLAHSSD